MRTLAAALVLAMMPSYAAAQEPSREGTTYLAVKVGAVIPQHDDLQGFDNGFALEGALGFRVNQNVALELGIGRFSISLSESGFVDGVGFVTATEDVVAYPVLASVKLTAPIDRVDLYGLLGGGLYFMSGDIRVTAPGFAPATENDSDTPFAFHLGGGLAVRLSPRALLGAEVKYVIGETGLFEDVVGVSTNFDSVMFGGTLAFSL